MTTHIAWFHRNEGHWVGEWKGRVPIPEFTSRMTGDERERVRNEWLKGVIANLGDYECEAQEWDEEAWNAAEPGSLVALEVSAFGWPVGDQRWNFWNESFHGVDWDERSVHRFIEVDVKTRRVVANSESHRPIRPSSWTRVVIDITNHPIVAHFGQIWGSFENVDGAWVFVPDKWRFKWKRPIRSFLNLRHAPSRKKVKRLAATSVKEFGALFTSLNRETVAVR